MLPVLPVSFPLQKGKFHELKHTQNKPIDLTLR
jgi:hypothetical protein